MDEKLGYQFHQSDESIGSTEARYDFNVYDEPTGEHFDPEEARLTIALGSLGAEIAQIKHPWIGRRTLRVCAGDIVLEDRTGKTVDAFVFGGELDVHVHENRTECHLVSPAPIYHAEPTVPGEVDDMASMLATEFEVLMAKRRAHWAGDPDEFASRLAAVDPVRLYAAAVAAAMVSIQSIPRSRRRARHRTVLPALRDATETLEVRGLWPAPPIAELL